MVTDHSIVDYARYRGQWLALDPVTEEILAHSSNLEDAEREAVDQGVYPVMEYVSESDGYFIGSV